MKKGTVKQAHDVAEISDFIDPEQDMVTDFEFETSELADGDKFYVVTLTFKNGCTALFTRMADGAVWSVFGDDWSKFERLAAILETPADELMEKAESALNRIVGRLVSFDERLACAVAEVTDLEGSTGAKHDWWYERIASVYKLDAGKLSNHMEYLAGHGQSLKYKE